MTDDPSQTPWDVAFGRLQRDPRQAARRLTGLWVAALIAFSVAPIWNNARGLQNKDYNLWYSTGRAYLRGAWIYPSDHRPFPFMYPPSCALMLAGASLVGETGCVVLLVLANSAAWVASVLLSVYLATGRVWGRHPLLYVVPSLVVIPFVHDMYLLGQPALGLLACLLGAFACLRLRRPWVAGGLIGLAAAVKAYPILALGYVVYRRQWKAAAATLVALALWLLVLPIPIRGAGPAWNDLATWTRGMVLKYDADAIAQRPERSYSYKNQSLIALSNRLLRSVPADGEAKDGWKVNVAALDFRSTNAVILIAGLSLCGFFLVALPRGGQRTERSDAVEGAMLLLLIQAFNPLSFDYSFIWIMYPLTMLLQQVLEAPARSRERTARLAGFAVAVTVFALSLPFHRSAEAYGNLLAADLILLVTLGLGLRATRSGDCAPASA